MRGGVVHSTSWKDLYHAIISLALILEKSGEMVANRPVLTEILLSARHAACHGEFQKFEKLYPFFSSVRVLVLDTLY